MRIWLNWYYLYVFPDVLHLFLVSSEIIKNNAHLYIGIFITYDYSDMFCSLMLEELYSKMLPSSVHYAKK